MKNLQILKVAVGALALIFGGTTLKAAEAENSYARIVCTEQKDFEKGDFFEFVEAGKIYVFDQVSVEGRLRSGAPAIVQGKSFIDPKYEGRSPVFAARIRLFTGKLDTSLADRKLANGAGNLPRKYDSRDDILAVNTWVNNTEVDLERFGEMGRNEDSVRFSHGHNTTSKERWVFSNSKTIGVVSYTDPEGNPHPRGLNCMKDYLVDQSGEIIYDELN